MIKHTITPANVIPANLHLIDSYKVSKSKFRGELQQMKTFHPNSEVWNRSFRSMEREWALHNALHACGIARERTKDCDLNYPQSFWVRIGYAIGGTLVRSFIR